MDNIYDKYKGIIDAYYSRCNEENRIKENPSIIGISHHILEDGMNVYIDKCNSKYLGDRIYVSMEPLDIFQIPPHLLKEMMESGQRQSYLMLEKNNSNGSEKISFNIGYGDIQTANIEFSKDGKCSYKMRVTAGDNPIYLTGDKEAEKDIGQLLGEAETSSYAGPYRAAYLKAKYNSNKIEVNANLTKTCKVTPKDIADATKQNTITLTDLAPLEQGGFEKIGRKDVKKSEKGEK